MQSNLPVSNIGTTPVAQPGNSKPCSEGNKPDQTRKIITLSKKIPPHLHISNRICNRKVTKPWTKDALYQLAQTTYYLIDTKQHNHIAKRLTTALANDKALTNNDVIDLMSFYMNFHKNNANINEYLYGHCYRPNVLSNLSCIFEPLKLDFVPAPFIETFINTVFGIRYINTIPESDIEEELKYYDKNPKSCDRITWNYLFGLIKKDNIKNKIDLFNRYYPKPAEQKTFRQDVLQFVAEGFLDTFNKIISSMPMTYEQTNTQSEEVKESYSDSVSAWPSREFLQSIQSRVSKTPYTTQSSTSDSHQTASSSRCHKPTLNRKSNRILDTLDTKDFPPALMDAIKRHIDSYGIQLPTEYIRQNDETEDPKLKFPWTKRLEMLDKMKSTYLRQNKVNDNADQSMQLNESLQSARPRHPRNSPSTPETN